MVCATPQVPGSQAAWPQKASKIVLDLLTNAESNAEVRARPLLYTPSRDHSGRKDRGGLAVVALIKLFHHYIKLFRQ